MTRYNPRGSVTLEKRSWIWGPVAWCVGILLFLLLLTVLMANNMRTVVGYYPAAQYVCPCYYWGVYVVGDPYYIHGYYYSPSSPYYGRPYVGAVRTAPGSAINRPSTASKGVSSGSGGVSGGKGVSKPCAMAPDSYVLAKGGIGGGAGFGGGGRGIGGGFGGGGARPAAPKPRPC